MAVGGLSCLWTWQGHADHCSMQDWDGKSCSRGLCLEAGDVRTCWCFCCMANLTAQPSITGGPLKEDGLRWDTDSCEFGVKIIPTNPFFKTAISPT